MVKVLLNWLGPAGPSKKANGGISGIKSDGSFTNKGLPSISSCSSDTAFRLPKTGSTEAAGRLLSCMFGSGGVMKVAIAVTWVGTPSGIVSGTNFTDARWARMVTGVRAICPGCRFCDPSPRCIWTDRFTSVGEPSGTRVKLPVLESSGTAHTEPPPKAGT